MKNLAQKVNCIAASQTVAISAKAQQMRAEGIDVISLSAGEPDFDTPVHIKEAAIKAIQDGFTKYTSPKGYPSLVSAVCEKFKNENGISYKPSQVVVSCGAKHSIFNALMALCEEGDEVIIPAPYWVTYPELVKLTGARPVILPTEPKNNFKISAEQLAESVTPKTKALILNYPGNPTGTVYSREELEAFASIACENDFYVISDEIYEKIMYGVTGHTAIASLGDDIYQRTITVNGVSKSFAMTGWRIGYLGACEEIAGAINRFQSQAAHHPCTISMKASEAALTVPSDCVDKMVEAFKGRREVMVDTLNQIPDVACSLPEGAFYVFPDVSAYYGKSFNGAAINGSLEMCAYLLDEMKIATVPGVAFGEERCIRLSYATGMEQIQTALDRLKEGLEKLK